MSLLRHAACSALLIAAGSHVHAEALPVAGEIPGQWRHNLTIYGFLPASTTGTSVVEGGEVELDMDLQDVLDLLQGALSLRYEAWNGNLGIITDGYYVHLQPGGSLDLPGPAGGSVDVDADIKQGWIALMGAYRFASGTNANGQPYALDASAGLRWNSIEQTVNAEASVPIGPGGGRTRRLGGTETWVEPVVGLRGAYQLSEDWALAGRVELGGFGVNGSDLQYTVLFGADWKAWERTSLKFGYQFYGIDYSTGSGADEFTYDVDQNGLYLGATFRF